MYISRAVRPLVDRFVFELANVEDGVQVTSMPTAEESEFRLTHGTSSPGVFRAAGHERKSHLGGTLMAGKAYRSDSKDVTNLWKDDSDVSLKCRQ